MISYVVRSANVRQEQPPLHSSLRPGPFVWIGDAGAAAGDTQTPRVTSRRILLWMDNQIQQTNKVGARAAQSGTLGQASGPSPPRLTPTP